MIALFQFILLALAIAAASFTLGRASVFSPIRDAIESRFPLLGELAHCPYCQSHYFAAVAAPFAPFLFGSVWLNWLVNAFALIALSAIFRSLFADN